MTIDVSNLQHLFCPRCYGNENCDRSMFNENMTMSLIDAPSTKYDIDENGIWHSVGVKLEIKVDKIVCGCFKKQPSNTPDDVKS